MTRQQLLKKFEGILVRRRDALLRSLAGELEQVNPRDQRNVGDSADAAVGHAFTGISSGLVEAESRELANTERALERLREGSYGVCENCGKRFQSRGFRPCRMPPCAFVASLPASKSAAQVSRPRIGRRCRRAPVSQRMT